MLGACLGKPLRVWNGSRGKKVSAIFSSMERLLIIGKQLLGIADDTDTRMVLENNGIELEDVHFNDLPDHSVVMFLNDNENWYPADAPGIPNELFDAMYTLRLNSTYPERCDMVHNAHCSSLKMFYKIPDEVMTAREKRMKEVLSRTSDNFFIDASEVDYNNQIPAPPIDIPQSNVLQVEVEVHNVPFQGGTARQTGTVAASPVIHGDPTIHIMPRPPSTKSILTCRKYVQQGCSSQLTLRNVQVQPEEMPKGNVDVELHHEPIQLPSGRQTGTIDASKAIHGENISNLPSTSAGTQQRYSRWDTFKHRRCEYSRELAQAKAEEGKPFKVTHKCKTNSDECELEEVIHKTVRSDSSDDFHDKIMHGLKSEYAPKSGKKTTYEICQEFSKACSNSCGANNDSLETMDNEHLQHEYKVHNPYTDSSDTDNDVSTKIMEDSSYREGHKLFGHVPKTSTNRSGSLPPQFAQNSEIIFKPVDIMDSYCYMKRPETQFYRMIGDYNGYTYYYMSIDREGLRKLKSSKLPQKKRRLPKKAFSDSEGPPKGNFSDSDGQPTTLSDSGTSKKKKSGKGVCFKNELVDGEDLKF